MSFNSRPVVGIHASRSIGYLNLDMFLNPTETGEIVTGDSAGIDTLAERWAKSHGVEWICYVPQYGAFGRRYAPRKRDEQIAEFVDKMVVFWDLMDDETRYILEYSKKLGVEIELHIVEER